MNIKKYIVASSFLAVAMAISCKPDPSLYPLPYDDRETGSYLRTYAITSNVWDIDDIANSGFEAIYESVDINLGRDLTELSVYATLRIGTTGRITDEVLVRTITDLSAFAFVPEPTFSDYLRSSRIRITAAETIAQLATLVTDPDGILGDGNCTGIFPKVCTMVAYPGSIVVGDRIIYRIKIKDNQGRFFTVLNPQTPVTPAKGNPNEANITPNITGGNFYASPMIYNVLVQRTTTTATPSVNTYVGNYRMAQVSRWQPDHTASQHELFPQSWIDKFAFGSNFNATTGSYTDSTQIVNLQWLPGMLSTERLFTCNYRNQTITMRINLEQAVLSQTGAGLAAAALSTVTAAAPGGYGFPAGTTNTNLGTVYVPLMSTTVNCSNATNRQFYFVTPLGGTFAGLPALPFGLPKQASVPNRGFYRFDRNGLTLGDVFTIALDDDADEYGRRNGYCNWFTRIQLTLTKVP